MEAKRNDNPVNDKLRNTANSSVSLQIEKKLQSSERSFDLNVTLELPAGITIVFGPSGAGKTTLLECIAGLIEPDRGTISVAGRVLFDRNENVNIRPQHRSMGYVFQDLALFPHLSVRKNVEYGLSGLNADERKDRAEKILASFRIAHLHSRKPAQISGGERQRVALARALVTDPSALLLDEPLAGLDAATKSKIMDDLRAWNAAHRIPILYVTHSRVEVFALGERMIVLENGLLIAQGVPHEVMSSPWQETVAELSEFENILEATVTAAHADRGTMSCHIAGTSVQLETPLVRAEVGSTIRIGIRAGDILLAVNKPVGLSARNILLGELIYLEKRDVIVMAKVDCGVEMKVQLTLAARDSLQLRIGLDVWLIVKTHSCHLMTVCV
ncbi:MAG: molybdate transport system ATP-binding protein [Acidobacteriaceae bacterium]